MNATQFKYINSLDEKEDLTVPCHSVEFMVSRYGEHWHKLEFAEPKTKREAIRAAEEYLSCPFDEEYYNKVSDDLGLDSWDEAQEYCNCRGDFIRGAIWLELTKLEDGHLILLTGS